MCFYPVRIAKMTKEELTEAELPCTCLSANRQHSINLLPYIKELIASREPLVDDDSLRLLLANSPNFNVQAYTSGHLATTLWPAVRASAQHALEAISQISASSSLIVNVDNRLSYLLACLIFRRQEFEPAIRLVNLCPQGFSIGRLPFFS